jgi:hypothetical protein
MAHWHQTTLSICGLLFSSVEPREPGKTTQSPAPFKGSSLPGPRLLFPNLFPFPLELFLLLLPFFVCQVPQLTKMGRKMFYMIDLQNFREKSYAVALGLGRIVPRKEIEVDLKRWFQLGSP